ncbi:MAG: SLC13 family permease, partial [Ferrovibrionaceae bacterium]
MIDAAAGLVPLALLFATALALSRAAVAVDGAPLLLGHVSRLAGDSPRRLLLGLLALTAAISALLPNAVTVLVMLPLLPRFVARFDVPPDHERLFATAAAAAVMWAANIGGMATIIGSAANAILVVYLRATAVPGVERLN